MKKVVIIGNSPSVTEHKLGDAIDSFNKVIRMNNFRIKGFKEYTGTKLDIFINGSQRWDLNVQLIKKCEKIWALYPLLQYYQKNTELLISKPIELLKMPRERFIVPNIAFIKKCYRDSGYPMERDDIEHPSTGLFGIAFTIFKFSEEYEIYIHGFDSFKVAVPLKPTPHYYEADHYEKINPFVYAHKHKLEKNYIEKLINEHKIKRLVNE